MSKEEKTKKFFVSGLASANDAFHELAKQTGLLNASFSEVALKSEEVANLMGKSIEGVTESFKIFRETTALLDKQFLEMANQRQEMHKQLAKILNVRSIPLQNLVDSITKINEQLGALPKLEIPKLEMPQFPVIDTELIAIPKNNNSIIEQLLAEIDFLEKELAKEKAEKEELLVILEEKRKELKKHYMV